MTRASVQRGDSNLAPTALFSVLVNNSELPFDAIVLGDGVTVDGLRLLGSGTIQAACRRGAHCQFIDLVSIKLRARPPVGVEWIHASWRWTGQR